MRYEEGVYMGLIIESMARVYGVLGVWDMGTIGYWQTLAFTYPKGFRESVLGTRLGRFEIVNVYPSNVY